MYVHLKIMQNTVNEKWWMFVFLKNIKNNKNAKYTHPKPPHLSNSQSRGTYIYRERERKRDREREKQQKYICILYIVGGRLRGTI